MEYNVSTGFMGAGVEEPLVLALIIPLTLILYLYVRKPGMNRSRWIFLSSRVFLIFLVLTALSSPYLIEEQEDFVDEASVSVLNDKSGSMSPYNMTLADEVYERIREEVRNSTGFESVDLKEFSGGDWTGIGDVLYQNSVGSLRETNLLILVSDGFSNLGRNPCDVAQALAGTGVKIFSLTPELSGSEVYIQGITGEKKVPANSDYRFTVDVGKLGDAAAEYTLDLFIDDQKINSSVITQEGDTRSIGYTVSFSERRVYEVIAEVIPKTGDHFPVNNRFMKTVDVVEKPRILIVSADGDSPLAQVLKQNYVVEVAGDLMRDLEGFSAVYVDNMDSGNLSDAVDSLYEYVIDGNGLVVVGGDKSYELGGYHENPRLEALLPVKSVGEPEKKRKDVAVVLLIDISESAGYGLTEDSKIDVEKALALNIVRQLDSKDYMGVIAFNVEAFVVSDMGTLGGNREVIEDKIPRLQFGGGTDMFHALDKAEHMLKDFSCKKCVIVISDGVLSRRTRIKCTQKIESMAKKDIIIYTVGVGFDTDEEFMSRMASNGNGLYFRPEAWERLKLEFEDKKEGDDDRYVLDVYNRFHFITQDIRLPYTTVSGFNDVSEKSISQVLVSTKAGKPVVTVWRFGLGRVVSLTTDNGLKWAPYFYSSEEGRLISAVTNWVVGDMEKKKKVRIKTRDISKGEEAAVFVECSELPMVHAGSEELLLKQVDLGFYSGRFTPNETGFYVLKAAVEDSVDTDAVAVNYPSEYSRLGVNLEELTEITGFTGGRIYNSSEVEVLVEDSLKFIREGSLRNVRVKTPLQLYLMAAVLSLFFIDVAIRRIKEVRRLRKEM